MYNVKLCVDYLLLHYFSFFFFYENHNYQLFGCSTEMNILQILKVYKIAVIAKISPGD